MAKFVALLLALLLAAASAEIMPGAATLTATAATAAATTSSDAPSTVSTSVSVPSSLTLSFEYACKNKLSYDSCLMNVFWNDNLVTSIVPSNYNVVSLSFPLTAAVGLNRLQFEGAGVSDGQGITIDNVKLVQSGSKSNLLVNGDFEDPVLTQDWTLFQNLPGWTGRNIELGGGKKNYNPNWTSQVIELDSYNNTQVTQTIYFDQNFNAFVKSVEVNPTLPPTLTYTLEFDYAAKVRSGYDVKSSRAVVIWNDEVVSSPSPTDFNIHHQITKVQLKAGENVLSFEGASYSDAHGLQIDNVKLTSSKDFENLILNGQFNTPFSGSKTWKPYDKGFLGWQTTGTIEMGDCSLYNSNWPGANKQCVELDATFNYRITQRVFISPSSFQILKNA